MASFHSVSISVSISVSDKYLLSAYYVLATSLGNVNMLNRETTYAGLDLSPMAQDWNSN